MFSKSFFKIVTSAVGAAGAANEAAMQKAKTIKNFMLMLIERISEIQ